MPQDRRFFYPVNGEAPAWEMYTPGQPSWEGEGHLRSRRGGDRLLITNNVREFRRIRSLKVQDWTR